MKKYLKCIAMMLGAMMLVSCGNAGKTYTAKDLSGEWNIVQVGGKPVKAEVEPFLGFQADDKQLYGNAGCNSLMGSFEVGAGQADALEFGALGSTKRMCADMEAEDAILQAMGQVKRFAFQADNRLVLKDAEGKELMVLEARK